MLSRKSLFRRLFPRRSTSPLWGDSEPIRGEIIGSDDFRDYGWAYASAHRVAQGSRPPRDIALRLADNAEVLYHAYVEMAQASAQGHAITPAAVWLIDNFHLVEKQTREIKLDLTPGYYRQLPKLADGDFAGYPRVLAAMWGFLTHTDSRFDPKLLCRYIVAYQ